MLEIAAVWENIDKNGKKYFSGNLGNSKLLILQNKYKKEGSKEPDYRVVICEKPKKEEATTQPFVVNEPWNYRVVVKEEATTQPFVANEPWMGGDAQGYGEKTNPFPGRV